MASHRISEVINLWTFHQSNRAALSVCVEFGNGRGEFVSLISLNPVEDRAIHFQEGTDTHLYQDR
jgi:hypothetical protein